MRTRLELRVMALESAQARRIVRRNYRWLRDRGVSKDMSRIILDSTLYYGKRDAWYAEIEQQELVA